MQDGPMLVQRIWQGGIDFDEFVETYQAEWPHVDENEIKNRLYETLKFLYIKLFVQYYEIEQDVSPSAVVDQMWHYLILHVSLYLKLCDKMMPKDFKIDGLRVIPHKPRDGLLNLPGNEKRWKARYEECLRLYGKIFGEPNERFWPKEVPKAEGRFRIFVQDNLGKYRSVSAEKRWKGKELAQAIAKALGLPSEQCRVLVGGKALQEELTVEEQGIKDEMTVHCIVRLRGC